MYDNGYWYLMTTTDFDGGVSFKKFESESKIREEMVKIGAMYTENYFVSDGNTYEIISQEEYEYYKEEEGGAHWEKPGMTLSDFFDEGIYM